MKLRTLGFAAAYALAMVSGTSTLMALGSALAVGHEMDARAVATLPPDLSAHVADRLQMPIALRQASEFPGR